MTSAGIGMVLPDGSIRAVRVNADGYPGHVGTILAGWYKEPERIKALLDLGERFDSNDPGKGNLTIAYRRDGGEEAAFPVQSFHSTEEYHRIGLDQLSADYLYLYDNGRWLVYGLYNDPDWIEMQVIIGKEQ